MPRLTSLIMVVSICIVTGCATTHHTPSYKVIAWNEDTVNNYQLAFKENGTFYYAIETNNGIKDTIERYKGAYGEIESEIYLKYTGKTPAGMTPYLVKEASGNYYIQNFTDGRKRIFLRIRKPHFRF